jgi:hypothetical protein
MIGLLVKAIQPGNEIITRINKYKADMKSCYWWRQKVCSILAEVESKFDVLMLKNREGI